jgi:hypothetical protein
VHVGRAVALAREAVAEAEECALMSPDERRESLDLLDLISPVTKSRFSA